MEHQAADFKEAAPHEDKLRKYRIGRWVTDCRLAQGWTMVDVAMRLHMNFPSSHLGNQGRISELETGNGVNRDRWTPEVVAFLHSIFQPCPPPPEDPWAHSDEWLAHLRRQEAAAEARRLADLARRQARPQPGLEMLWAEDEAQGAPSGPQPAP
jgi:hypothetical protein